MPITKTWIRKYVSFKCEKCRRAVDTDYTDTYDAAEFAETQLDWKIFPTYNKAYCYDHHPSEEEIQKFRGRRKRGR